MGGGGLNEQDGGAGVGGEVHMHSEKDEARWCCTALSRLRVNGSPPRTNLLVLGWRHKGSSRSLFSLLCTRFCQEIPCRPQPCTGPEPYLVCISSGPMHSYATGKSRLCKGLPSSPNRSIAGMPQLALRQIHRLPSDCFQNTECVFVCGLIVRSPCYTLFITAILL